MCLQHKPFKLFIFEGDIIMTYAEYLNNIISTRGQWSSDVRYSDRGCERHHIILQCKGGQPTKLSWKQHINIIWLYPYEHFIAHKLLAQENPNDASIQLAFIMMAYPKGKTKRNYELTPEDYEELRSALYKARKGKHLSDETKKKLRDANIGKHASYETRQKLSEKSKGRRLPDSAKLKIGIANKKNRLEHPEKYKCNNKDCIAISNNLGELRYIAKNDKIPDGWYAGNCKTAGSHDMSNYTEQMRERRKELSRGENNNMYNKGYKIAGGKNGKAIYIYTFNGIDYQCRDDLMIILKQIHLDISESAIRRIMKGTYTKRISNKYQDIIDNLTWRLKCENIVN